MLQILPKKQNVTRWERVGKNQIIWRKKVTPTWQIFFHSLCKALIATVNPKHTMSIMSSMSDEVINSYVTTKLTISLACHIKNVDRLRIFWRTKTICGIFGCANFCKVFLHSFFLKIFNLPHAEAIFRNHFQMRWNVVFAHEGMSDKGGVWDYCQKSSTQLNPQSAKYSCVKVILKNIDALRKIRMRLDRLTINPLSVV